MLALQTQKKIASKIIKLADGRLALAHFLVWVENGEIKGQLLSLRTQDQTDLYTQETLLLKGDSVKQQSNFTVKDFYQNPILSPYFADLILSSQPTRAPSL